MKTLLKQFENSSPEIVFEWNDRETDARGWVVINSLRGGAAGGGTRMRKGLDKHEVLSLAKTMEVKFTVSGPNIGGAKSGIDFDPSDPRRDEVLKRWFKAVIPMLKSYYGTGGDLNVDEIHDVIPITENLGLWHPQEGVLTGHFNPTDSEKIHKIGQLRQGVSKVIEDASFSPDTSRKYCVADMITGYGVWQSVEAHYALLGKSVKGARVLIQGWGNVGAAAAYFAAQAGASVTGIVDRNGGRIDSNGTTFEQVREFFVERNGNQLNEKHSTTDYATLQEKIWDESFDIFLPCAASRLVQRDQIDRLIAAGLSVVSCGANVPFADQEIFYGPITEAVDQQIALIPDFVSNCGMARVFAYLMGTDVELSDDAIFTDARQTIFNAMKKIHGNAPRTTLLAEKAFEIALETLL
jgi:glutamate dehydrogenase/leucine dehydrogenase